MIASAIIPVWKPLGRTPLDCVQAYRTSASIPQTIPVSYAGRLDPMAEGVLVLLVGDENAKRRQYEHWDKTYEVKVLLGFQTDTGDLLGHVNTWAPTSAHISDIALPSLQLYAQGLVGVRPQQYPPYSSIKVGGVPLWVWARSNKLHEIQIPTHTVDIQSIQLLSLEQQSKSKLSTYITRTISAIPGDFRQPQILHRWNKVLNDEWYAQEVTLVQMQVACGSGTYMRVLAEELGTALGVPACAYSIVRTKAGTYTTHDCVSLWAN